MTLYRVTCNGPYNTCLSTSWGYSTRQSAERVAAGLASAGKAPHGVNVEPYEAKDSEIGEDERA